jgi:hypothetical protein
MDTGYTPAPLSETVYLFTRYGLGSGPAELQLILATKFLALVADSGELPSKILFYNEGVKLACQGSPVLEPLKALESGGVELILCLTCLDYLKLKDQVEVGVVGGMPDIIETLHKAGKVIAL